MHEKYALHCKQFQLSRNNLPKKGGNKHSLVHNSKAEPTNEMHLVYAHVRSHFLSIEQNVANVLTAFTASTFWW
jgi:hypothetical protein